VTNRPSLDAIDAEVRRISHEAMGKSIDLLDRLILHINHGKAALTGSRHDRGRDFLIGVLLSRAFNSLWRAREDAVCGYYPESLTLCRSAAEHWLAVKWLELHPEPTDRWLWAILEEVPRPEDLIPKVGSMFAEVDPDGLNKRIYDMLSKFVHPRGTGLRWMIHWDETSTYFHVGGHFDERNLRTCLYFLIIYAQACLRPTAALLERMLGSIDEKWLNDGVDISKEARSFVESVETEIIKAGMQLEIPSDEEGALQS
jgi:hypothetical protein